MNTNKGLSARSAKAVSLILSVFIASCGLFVRAEAKKSYISEITVAVGADGRTSLESDGYSVLFQGLNLAADENSSVFLGYKKGSDAITGIVVSEQLSDSLEYGGCSYKPASGANLNEGTDGTPLYLYFTKDGNAGSGITSLDTVSGFSDREDVISLRNDGSSPVRMTDGTLADLEKGIENSEIYLLLYRSGNVRKYISDVCIVKGDSKAEAINAASSNGCDFYLDNNLSGENGYAYIAYSRTSDKKDAVTNLTVNGFEVQTAKNEQSDAFLIDIAGEKLFADTFALGEWAGVYAVSDKSVSKNSDEYKSLLSSSAACSCVSAGSDIFAVYEGVKNTSNSADAATTESETQTADAATTEPTTQTNDAATTESETQTTNAATTESETQTNDTATTESATQTADGTTAESATQTADAATTEPTTQTNDAATTESATQTGDATEEFLNIDKSETTLPSETSSDDTATASVINGGNIATVLILSAIAVLAVTGAAIYTKKKRKCKNEKSD